MRFISLSLFMALMSAGFADAAEVISFNDTQQFVGISHPISRKWQLNDNVCVIQQEHEVACGLVVKATPKIGVVKIDSKTARILRGDRVELASLDRKPTAVLLDAVPVDSNAKQINYNLSAGISFGFNYFFPMVNFQRSVSHHFAVGLVPLYFRGSAANASAQGIGAFVTGNYYYNGGFRGLWGQLGAGVNFLSTSTTLGNESAVSPAVLATIGWRGYWDMGLNIGVGAGIQWVRDPNFSTLTLSSTGFRPLVLLDLGVNF